MKVKLKITLFILLAIIAVVFAVEYCINTPSQQKTFEFFDIVIIVPLLAISLAILVILDNRKKK